MVRTSRVNRGRRNFVAGAAAGALGIAFGAHAQGMSKRPVRIILAQTPGTTPDVIARTLAPRLQARWDQIFIVENRPGASGAIGMEAVTKATPDGHTIMVNVATTLTLPYFFPKLPFDVLKSFTPITYIASGNFALTVHQALPVNSVQEFVAYVKARPGQLNYGSPGFGTHHHLCMELLKYSAGLDIVHVPYKGSAGATTDLLGGQIPAMFVPIHQALAFQKDGKVRVLGGSKRERLALFPEIPSIAEQGVRDFDVDPWFALWGPPGLPSDIVARYNTEVRDILNQPELRENFARQGLVAKPGTPAELTQIAKAEHEMWGRLIRAAKIAVPE